jgi:hypothetical protein
MLRIRMGYANASRKHQCARSLIGQKAMKRLTLISVILAASFLSACGSTTGSRAGSGAAMGAAGGALIGSMSANAGRGALIGAGAGALGGYLYDQHQKGNID